MDAGYHRIVHEEMKAETFSEPNSTGCRPDVFAYRELVPESLVVALPDKHPLAERDSIAPKGSCTGSSYPSGPSHRGGFAQAVLAECADAGFQPKRLQEVATAQAALGLVSAQFGIAILPGSVRSLTRTGVTLKPIRSSRIQIQLALLWPKDNP